MGSSRDVGHDLDVLAVDRLFDEHRLVGFQNLDEQLGCLRGDRPVEIDADITLRARGLAQFGKLLRHVVNKGLVLDHARRAPLGGAGLEGGESLSHALLYLLGGACVRIASYLVPGGAAGRLVNRHSECFPFDVPQRLVDSTECAGQYRPAAIEGMAVNRLPVMGYSSWILSDQVRLRLLNRLSASQSSSLGDRLSQSGDSGVGVNLQEKPSGFNQECLELGDFDAFFDRGALLGRSRWRRRLLNGRSASRVLCRKAGSTYDRCRTGQKRTALNTL